MMTPFNLFYQYAAKPILFRFDPEFIHELVLSRMGLCRPFKSIINRMLAPQDSRLERTIWGRRLPHPIGLAGGFDKNAVCTDLWDAFGFSHFEIGTLTPRPQPGNPKPRLFRYPDSRALVNRMGFNNGGSQAAADLLTRKQSQNRSPTAMMGVSLGKQFDTPADDIGRVIEDYTISLERLYRFGDFFVVNVSSPNTPNLRTLQEGEKLAQLLAAMQKKMDEIAAGEKRKPLCVKLAPDLSGEQIREALGVIRQLRLDGVIATNTTNQTGGRESGGMSGEPLRQRSTEVVRLAASELKGKIPIIGCGGIFNAEDAVEKLAAGAQLLQIYTGFVYQGPAIVRDILKGILRMMDERGLKQLDDFRDG
ncbi:MAG: quinone-dependent dihydroorotate dehydrogenase [Candidatus Omnitrophota bacterium]